MPTNVIMPALQAARSSEQIVFVFLTELLAARKH